MTTVDRTQQQETDPVERFREALRAALGEQLPHRARSGVAAGSVPDRAQRRAVAREILAEARREHTETELRAGRSLLDQHTEQAVMLEVENETFGLAGLQHLLDDPEIETVNVNRWDRVFVRYADGRRERVAPVAASNEELTALVRALAARASSEERRFDRGSCQVNVQLPGGERLNAVMAVTHGGHTALSIRRHGYRTTTLDHQRRDLGTLSRSIQAFEAAAVRARKNILITGGTAIGKTTHLRALASEIPPEERIVTIEDAFELGLGVDEQRHPDVVALQARQPNIEGVGGISQAEMVRWALRMSPDRVIVGEIRGPELVPALNAMSQGNDGSMATLHASSSKIAFTRLASYAAQGPERLPVEATNLLVASAVHFVVHLDIAPDTGTRVVSSIREVVDADGAHIISNEVFRPGPDRRAVYVPGALRTRTLDDLIAAGLDPAVLDGQW